MNAGRTTRCRAALPLGARAQHRQRAPYPHSPLGPVSRCTEGRWRRRRRRRKVGGGGGGKFIQGRAGGGGVIRLFDVTQKKVNEEEEVGWNGADPQRKTHRVWFSKKNSPIYYSSLLSHTHHLHARTYTPVCPCTHAHMNTQTCEPKPRVYQTSLQR